MMFIQRCIADFIQVETRGRSFKLEIVQCKSVGKRPSRPPYRLCNPIVVKLCIHCDHSARIIGDT